MSMFRLPTITVLALLGAVGIASAQTKSPDSAQSEVKPAAPKDRK